MLYPASRKILLLGGLLVVLLSGATAARLLLARDTPPDIRGTFLPEGRPLEPFTLTDHRGQAFSRGDLKGQWHLVSYGFTYCPDICPMTLMRVARVLRDLEDDEQYGDLRVLFYSVDSARDTPEQLANYVPHFHADFIGLSEANPGRDSGAAFEQSLGIVARIDPEEQRQNPEHYSVSHGVSLYLLNPRGELQAVFEPELNPQNLYVFSEERLYRDYRAVRAWLKENPN